MATNNPKDVELDVVPGTTEDGGWTATTGSNNQPYSYRYTGGDDTSSAGAVTFKANGTPGIVNLSLVAGERFKFDGKCVRFVNDTEGQLSASGNAPRTRIINDRCSATLDASYKVTVTDSEASATIDCDPPIRNNPN